VRRQSCAVLQALFEYGWNLTLPTVQTASLPLSAEEAQAMTNGAAEEEGSFRSTVNTALPAVM
jgi:hypothetical protein